MNISDLARELNAEPYGFCTWANIPQGMEIDEQLVESLRAHWLNEQAENIVDVEYHPEGGETIHERRGDIKEALIAQQDEHGPWDYV